MSLTRRAYAGLSVGALAGLAGCSFLQGPIAFDAKPAAAGSAALSETGYEHVDTRKPTVSRTFAGKEVRVTNVLNEYQKTLDVAGLGSAKVGVFAAFTTPQVKVADRGPFNPVADWSNREIAKRLQSRFGSFQDIREVGSTRISVLGTDTRVSKFRTTTTYEGTELDLFLHITKVKHDEDVVVLLGIYPKPKVNEEGNVLSLLRSVSHPA